jgi:HPt (histidine-containing phosphotransfer) domain-containing protein
LSQPFDPARGLNATANDPTLLRRVGGSLSADLGNRIAGLQAAVTAGNLDEVHRHAHRNKGSCLVVGAIALGERFAAIDQAARAGKLDEVRALTVDLPAMAEAFTAALGAWTG